MKDKYYYKGETKPSKRDMSKKLHRIDGPAVEYADGCKYGYKSWYVDGKRHRIDGPAIEYANGVRVWYVDNQRYSKKGFNKLIKEIKELPLALRLIDPREWVRKL